MQSAKKTTKILSALSMAAAAVCASKAAHGATLTMYYGQDVYANSNNGIFIGTGLNKAGVGTDTSGQTEYLTGVTTPASIPVSQTTATTITLPVGDFISLSMDAVLTGNLNADAGATGVGAEPAQPTYLGLSSLGTQILSSDTNATYLTPIALNKTVLSSAGGHPTFTGFSKINQTIGTNTGNSTIPIWAAIATPGDVQPNLTGFDPGTGSGQYGINGYNNGGNTSGTGTTAAGIRGLTQFANQSSQTPSYGNATDFVDSLVYQGLTTGVVTLTPLAAASATSYWVNATKASGSSPSTYKTHNFSGADTITQLPVIVIDVVGAPPLSHAIVSLADTATDNTNYATPVAGTFSPSTAPTLTVHGGSGGYTVAQVTAINAGAGDVSGNVPVTTWNPTTDAEIYGVDVKVGGQQATATQLATLLNAINGGDGTVASAGVTAGTTDPSRGQVLAALDTGTTTYNLFLDFPGGGPSATDDLGLDLGATNDANLVGYTFTAISVVPEPMSLSLLALGGVGLMARRNRRKA